MKRSRSGKSIASRAADTATDVEPKDRVDIIGAHTKSGDGALAASARRLLFSATKPGAGIGDEPATSALNKVAESWRQLLSEVAIRHPAELARVNWHFRALLELVQAACLTWQSVNPTPSTTTTPIDWAAVDATRPLNPAVLTLWMVCAKECCAILGKELLVATHTPSQHSLLLDVLLTLSAGIAARESNVASAELLPAFDSHASATYVGYPASKPGQATSVQEKPQSAFTLVVRHGLDTVAVKVTKQTSVSMIFAAVSRALKVESNDLRLLFDGHRILPMHFVGDFDLQDGDNIDCMMAQSGD